ncbi:MAG: gamma carbonic anhydrase family protein [Thermoanaerobaculia bacterium]|nr:gamma carbonic anhydrase family protein [Thermoanaerobaculia bacterium]
MPIYPFRGIQPQLGERVYLAPSAELSGDIVLGDDVSFWFHTAARGDVNTIRIGNRSNIQDGVVLHVTHETHPLVLGEGVVVGHSAMLHGCTIEDGALIGIGARVLDGAIVRQGAQVGAGAVVTPGTEIPAHHLAVGIPARVVRALTAEEQANNAAIADRYVALKEEYRALELGPLEAGAQQGYE